MRRSGSALAAIYDKVLHGERLTGEDGMRVYDDADLIAIGILADTARALRTPENTRDYVYWAHNFHINPTNICEAHCRFCSFKKGPGSPHAYVLSVDDIVASVEAYPEREHLAEFHIVSGLYEKQGLDYYVSLFRALSQRFPHVHIKGLTAVEIHYLSQLAGVSHETALRELQAVGLKSMPGGGAEVFAERVRKDVCADKITAEEWLSVHETAHGLGIRTNATLLAGLGETPQERVEHMLSIRAQQDRSGGFMSFIPLNCYYDNNQIDPRHALTGVENLKNFAVSRLLLDNVPHIKSFWIHIGEKLSQVSLSFGVDDLDGTVSQEKIAHAAGSDAPQALTREALMTLIWRAGKIPVERDSLYGVKQVFPAPEPALP
ncbi:MAG: CofH family radical SAM protein [Vampirovibrionales bacterium]|nr:CofH family radical SAM protein [Vampirovibrionales bacterium]